jgi:hypothetical protein
MAEDFIAVRVRITVWLTSGMVSSRPSAAAAAKAGNARRHVVGNAERQPSDLLGDRPIERRVAGMDARHLLAA